MYADYQVAVRAMAAAGVLLECAPLQGASLATTVRVRGGQTMLTDGPAAELKEQVGGYTLVECADLDEALKYAAMIPAAKTGSGPGSQVARAAAAAASWRTQRIRSAAAWGWSPNSCAIRLTQPRVPGRRTARLIAAATLSAAGAADRCSAEANSASHHASSTFSRVRAVLPAGDVLAGEGTGSPGAGAPRRAKRTGNPPVSRACVRVDVPDEVVTVSLLTSRLPCCCG